MIGSLDSICIWFLNFFSDLSGSRKVSATCELMSIWQEEYSLVRSFYQWSRSRKLQNFARRKFSCFKKLCDQGSEMLVLILLISCFVLVTPLVVNNPAVLFSGSTAEKKSLMVNFVINQCPHNPTWGQISGPGIYRIFYLDLVKIRLLIIEFSCSIFIFQLFLPNWPASHNLQKDKWFRLYQTSDVIFWQLSQTCSHRYAWFEFRIFGSTYHCLFEWNAPLST